MEIREPRLSELDHASGLCLRSKAYWGYDKAFMASCVDELTLTETDLAKDKVAIAIDQGSMAGVVQISNDEAGCFLEKLFVDPSRMGEGLGRNLFSWAVSAARELGAAEIIVEADPDAVPFYRRMGCVDAGFAPSGSIPGRQLPRLIYRLES